VISLPSLASSKLSASMFWSSRLWSHSTSELWTRWFHVLRIVGEEIVGKFFVVTSCGSTAVRIISRSPTGVVRK